MNFVPLTGRNSSNNLGGKKDACVEQEFRKIIMILHFSRNLTLLKISTKF